MIARRTALYADALRLLADYGEDVALDYLPLLSPDDRARLNITIERRRLAIELASIPEEERVEKIKRGRNARVASDRLGLL